MIGTLIPAKGEISKSGVENKKGWEDIFEFEENSCAKASLPGDKGDRFLIGITTKGLPAVVSLKTNRAVVFLWGDMVSLAVARGVNDDEPAPNPADVLEKLNG